MFSLLPLRILYFPCYVEVSLDFELERIFQKKNPKIFQNMSDGQTDLILKRKCTFT